MTKEERRVKHYVDAWCEGKRVQCSVVLYNKTYWEDIPSIFHLLRAFHNGHSLRIVKGKRV